MIIGTNLHSNYKLITISNAEFQALQTMVRLGYIALVDSNASSPTHDRIDNEICAEKIIGDITHG